MTQASAALGPFAKELHETTSRAQSCEIYLQERPGTAALHWLLSNDKIAETDFETAASFATWLMHSLVGENAHGLIDQFLLAERPAHSSERALDFHACVNIFVGQNVRAALQALC